MSRVPPGPPRRIPGRAGWTLVLAVLALAFAWLEPRRDAQLSYVDPGLGTMIVQLLAVGFFGLLFYLKSFRRYLARLVSRFKKRA